ncbi:MAG: 16S rRNA (guanine(966)-N(2))-methyltransferase RsmD [Clostridiales bacterium]|nr:16S rRNA (guanine(966)-N(2))-methyltransferase RsmD [Clostridiales bacterium]
MRIIAGTARGRSIEAPKGLDTRPTLDRVRENLFNILQRKTWDARVLDLFAGTGALSLEALSRGAAEAVLVDCHRAAHACQRQNAEKLGFAGQTRILLMDWQQAVCQLAAGEKFDLVFLDPPYAMRDLTGVMASLKPLLAEEAVIIVEHEAKVMPATADGYEMYDSRKYGYVGVSFFRRAEA